jgi:hypothetical protein
VAGVSQPRRSNDRRSASVARFSGLAGQFVSNRPIWLGDAPVPFAALPPMIQRMVGSCRKRSASFTSSYSVFSINLNSQIDPQDVSAGP